MTRAHDLQVLAAQIGVMPRHGTRASGSSPASVLGMASHGGPPGASLEETRRVISKTDVPSLFETFEISKTWKVTYRGTPDFMSQTCIDLIRRAWHGEGPPVHLILNSEHEGEGVDVPTAMRLDVSVGSMELEGRYMLNDDLNDLAEHQFVNRLSNIEGAEYEFKMLFESRFGREFAVNSSDQITLSDLSIRLEAYSETLHEQLVELQSHLEEKVEEARAEADRAHQEADRIGREVADKIEDEIDRDVDEDDDEEEDDEDDEDEDFDARYR